MMDVVATFRVEYTQFLNPQGDATQSLPEFARDPAALLPLYRAMVRTRLFDAKAITLQRTGKLGTFASSLAVGVAYAFKLRREARVTVCIIGDGGPRPAPTGPPNTIALPRSIVMIPVRCHHAGSEWMAL
jgi:TPP-dependent pyruvate/acetoin dehydrogenase alpha subunit